MENKDNQNLQEDSVVKAIKEEYENKIDELKKQHEEEIKKVREEEEQKSIRQIRAIISGRKEENPEDNPKEKVDKSFFETALEETLNNFNIKS